MPQYHLSKCVLVVVTAVLEFFYFILTPCPLCKVIQEMYIG